DQVTLPAEGKDKPAAPVAVTIRQPPRIKFTLREVDQDFFTGLDRLLGGYVKRLEGLDPGRFVTAPDPAPARTLGQERPPAPGPNPVIVFKLRPGVRFHDGVEVTAPDVRFTYETIVDPRNLSPRVPDYEPVKSVEAVDRYTVRVTYKEL